MPNTEPVLTANGIVAAISAIVAALVGFGIITWSGEQQQLFIAAIVAILGIVAPLVAGFWSRSQTTPLSDPKVVIDGEEIALIRADNEQPPPQAGARAYARRLGF